MLEALEKSKKIMMVTFSSVSGHWEKDFAGLGSRRIRYRFGIEEVFCVKSFRLLAHSLFFPYFATSGPPALPILAFTQP